MIIRKIIILFMALNGLVIAQYNPYGPSDTYPYGRINPDAPKQLADFEEMIGSCDCLSQNRNPDGSWQDTLKMVWVFEYIMNGLAVQDKTYLENNRYAGSIRMFNSDSSNWYVHFYASTSAASKLNTWSGNRENDKIVLSRPQKTPSGMEGFSRLTFYDISDDGFKWIGEWHNPDTTIVYPFWKIECVKRK